MHEKITVYRERPKYGIQVEDKLDTWNKLPSVVPIKRLIRDSEYPQCFVAIRKAYTDESYPKKIIDLPHILHLRFVPSPTCSALQLSLRNLVSYRVQWKLSVLVYITEITFF